MSIKVPLNSIVNPGSITVPTIDTAGDQSFLQIYTGTIVFLFETADELAHDEVISFIPLDSNLQLLQYNSGTTFITAVGSLASLGVDDTPYVGAVDSVTVNLEKNSFVGVGGTPNVLVMHARVAVRNGGVGRIAYQVNVHAGSEIIDRGRLFSPPGDSVPGGV